MKKGIAIFLIITLLAVSSCGGKKTENNSKSESSASESAIQSSEQQSSAASSETAVSSSITASKASSNKPASPSTVTPFKQVKGGVLSDEAKNLGITNEMLTRSLVSEGNLSRIANAMKKAMKGLPVTVGVIGGSITQGTGSSSPAKSYAGIVESWWRNNFPKSKITFINAGIGATSSIIGVHRADADLLSQKPDFVIIEFAVNDGSTTLYKETYEGLVRKTLKCSSNPGVMLLFMVDSKGTSAQYIHSQVGKNYNLPMVSYKDAMWPEIQNKKYAWTDISPDAIHPNDKGHAIAGELVLNFLRKVYDKVNTISASISPIANPITSNRFENGKLYTSKTIKATSLGSFKVSNDAFWEFKDGWVVKGGTSPIVFNINAKNVFILYTKSVNGSGGKATIKVNGGSPVTINSDFAGGWGDYADQYLACSEATTANQKIEIQLQPEGTKNEFAIIGIMVS